MTDAPERIWIDEVRTYSGTPYSAGIPYVRADLFDTMTQERDDAKGLVIEANNSLYGSQGYFHSLDGGPYDRHHLARSIERIKEYGREQYQRADDALALVAAAYEAAVAELTPLFSSALASKESAHTESFANAMGERADGIELSIRRIRALTPADALAAQARRDERMRAEGMATAYAKAQQAIADLPYPKDEAAVNEQENCYRAVEALATLEKHHE